jgi:hypothetical protein
MPSFLFVCVPMHGHLWPAVRVAAALAAQIAADDRSSNSVVFAGLEQSRALVESLGVPFASLGELPASLHVKIDAALRAGTGGQPRSSAATRLGPLVFGAYLRAMYPPLLRLLQDAASEGRPFDVLVADHATMAAYGARASAARGMPGGGGGAAGPHPPLPQNGVEQLASQLGALRTLRAPTPLHQQHTPALPSPRPLNQPPPRR